ncbi:MAG: hypothetical protein ABIH46_05990, partial [Chloroflexota bacterium]
MKPRDAITFDGICQLERDNIYVGNFWMSLQDDTVMLVMNPKGWGKAQIVIPRDIFDVFVDWYNTGEYT